MSSGIEHDPGAHVDADRVIDGNTDPPHDSKHLVMRTDARTASGEVIARALVYLYIEPGKPQHVGSKEPTQ